MAMAVDAAGGDEAAGRIHHLSGVAEIVTDGDDLACVNGDVTVHEVDGGGDGSAADDEIGCWHES